MCIYILTLGLHLVRETYEKHTLVANILFLNRKHKILNLNRDFQRKRINKYRIFVKINRQTVICHKTRKKS